MGTAFWQLRALSLLDETVTGSRLARRFDLVGSPPLSARLDLEDLRGIIRAPRFRRLV